MYGDFPHPKFIPGGHIFMAILRNVWLSLRLLFDVHRGAVQVDVLFVDQLSVSIPILLFTGAKVT